MPTMPAKKSRIEEEQALHRKLLKLWHRGQSPYCEVRGSEIHGRGVYAAQAIPAGTKIIEYVGELVDKRESERRGVSQHAKSVESGDAAVYIFTLSERYDIDGNVPWNTARLINHSCEPNCEAEENGCRVFIKALRDLSPGEELFYDYGLVIDERYTPKLKKEYACRCGAATCRGTMLAPKRR